MLGEDLNLEDAGQEMYELISSLYPICRSITGDGVRRTLQTIGNYIPVVAHEVPTGTPIFDWTVPREWNIRDAYIKRTDGNRIVDFRQTNLHVVSYSTPVNKRVSIEELKRHLYSLPNHPDWVPYRTSYYKEDWGFCVSHNQLMKLSDDEYDVCIDSTLEPGHLTYGEYFLPGDSSDEVLISCHLCHPSLCNDNLSGVAVSVLLARYLGASSRRYSYRFLYIPGTIGSIAWLCLNEAGVHRIKHGLVLACVGDSGRSTYKKSRRGNAEIDRAAVHVLKQSGSEYQVMEFNPYGYDERQYCSPAFDLPVGCLMRTPHGCFPEYHTSADNLEMVRSSFVADSFGKCLRILDILENNKTYISLNPKCEPQLGKRGLYKAVGGGSEKDEYEHALLWTLNLSDGRHSLLEIAERSGLNFEVVKRAAQALSLAGLLEEVSGSKDTMKDWRSSIHDASDG